MTEQNQDGAQRIFINEVQRHQARYRKLIQFTHSSTKAAGVMLLAAVVALIVANTGAYEAFLESGTPRRASSSATRSRACRWRT